MNDSMKFGPEWLRNMRPENTGNSSIGTIKMAEFRYGREEMLALFDRTVLAPDPLNSIQGLHIEKTQPPLALIQMTEEETRLWNRGVNSDAVLRSVVKPGSTGPGGPGGVGGGTRGGVGGRGGSVDRGRGRARGGFHYSRGLSYEDSDGPNNTTYSRGLRPFDRSQVVSQGSSGWSERNGDTGDWSGGNMSNSPRKEFSSRSMSDTNWRRQRGSGDDDEAWRSQRHEKWGRGSSWRDGDSNWDSSHRSGSGSRTWDDGSSQSSRRQWDIEENNLPEWATENPSESGGSFDASGAFHGGGIYSDEEEDGLGRVEASRSGSIPNNKSTSPVLSTNKDEHSNITNGISPTQTERIGGVETAITRSSSNIKKGNSGGGGGGGLRQSQSATSLSAGPSLPERKISAPSQKHNHSISTSTSLTGINTQTKSENSMKHNGCESTRSSEQSSLNHIVESTSTPQLSQMITPSQPQLIPVQESSCQQEVKCEKSEEEFDRLLEEHTDDLVNKLMEDEESASSHSALPTSTPPTVPIQPQTPQNIVPDSDKWYYCDPQGVVQGPFHASEMAEWYKSGYFSLNLMLRRACDEKYVMLGDLVLHYGYVPFMSQMVHPPIKASDLLPQTHGLPLMSKPIDEQIMKFIRHQQIMAKLSQSDHFNSLPSVEQQQILLNQPAVQQDIPVGPAMYQLPTQPPVSQVPQPQPAHNNTPTNPVLALYHQLTNQGKAALVPPPTQPVPTPVTDPPLPVLTQPPAPQLLSTQILQQFAALQGHMKPTPTPVNLQKNAEEQRKRDHLLNIIRESTNSQQNTQPTKMDSLWGGAAALPANFTPNWPQQTVMPPGQLPQSLWGELHAKGMKTEQEILDEQLRAEEERKKEELRKQEELERLKKEMEEKERKRKEEEELERRRKKEEEMEKKRLKEEEERKKQEAAAKKAEQERLKREEEKKRKEEERKRKEEEKRRQEEEKRRLEEEQKKAEEEKKKREEEARRAEQAKKQAEALKRLQEQQQQARTVKTSTTSAWTSPETATTSLPDIQKTERKQQQQQREQQQLLQLIQQEARNNNNNNNNKSGTSLNLKWAETKQPPARVKSLAEIQAEEQERLMKQNEREKAERIAQGKEVQLSATNSIWANQNLTWNAHNSASVWGNSTAIGAFIFSSNPFFQETSLNVHNIVQQNEREKAERIAQGKEVQLSATNSIWANQNVTWSTHNSASVWGNSIATGSGSTSAGFWEDVPPVPPAKQNTKTGKQQSGGTAIKTASGKGRAKKEEMVVMKLFEQQPKYDEFYQWCNRTLSAMQSSVDIPTFVGFLRDIESPYEVREYVRMYLGEGKDALEFASQFVERRSEVRSGETNRPENASTTTTNSHNFQEVKGKSKKVKKGKMMRVDNKILGFNVTAAPDRINVGDRDYGEGL